MRELPILFSGKMVQAILNGHKSMTRRLNNLEEINQEPDKWRFIDLQINSKGDLVAEFYGGNGHARSVKCPWKPGDRLWVRETWTEIHGAYFYRADADESIIALMEPHGAVWHPSIFMPKLAARIWLEVTNIRVERLQEITEEDAMGEGLRIGIGGQPYFSCRDAFIALWNNLNAKRGYSWDTNPFCWVIEFRRVV